jgi:geranylgeranyl pyrophosphate synthase
VFGENMAILSGDALLVYAFEHIARDTKGVSPERVVKVVIELARASGADGLVGGQVVDIQSEDKEVRGLGGGLKVCVWGRGEGGLASHVCLAEVMEMSRMASIFLCSVRARLQCDDVMKLSGCVT